MVSPIASLLFATFLVAEAPTLPAVAALATDPATAEPGVAVSEQQPAPSTPPPAAPVPSGTGPTPTPNNRPTPPVTLPPPAASRPQRLLLMPFFGVQGAPSFFLGNGNLGTGTRLGGLAGADHAMALPQRRDHGRLRQQIDAQTRLSETLTEWLLTFSPLFHVGNLRPNDWRPILAGPKLGLLWGSGDGYYYGDRFNWYGWTYGGELGGFDSPLPDGVLRRHVLDRLRAALDPHLHLQR